ncbi:DUF1516 family protein [Oenococcus sicerae]|uniref:DUF1516 family protein n=1 Tax=Oenococcus sicerae TaxID=2203724 RepID=A0AAJ1RCD5_9LACO|nr:DUF1516 family protein [Oenococcus sicerae]MDN6901048.1 DUF1516 family protein [Oenococcus sicerae]QAS70081.1 DUF1516 family protein [Oenococcus sicerae]
MKIILAIHILSVISIAITATAALLVPLEQDKRLVLATRVIYLPLFISGLVLALKTVHAEPVLTIIKIAAALAFVAVLEITFARKINKKPAAIVLSIIALLFFLAAILGIMIIAN